MDEKINEFLDFIVKQKNYSKYTNINYEIDINEFKKVLSENRYQMDL
jgi:site-specific recombinase XerD